MNDFENNNRGPDVKSGPFSADADPITESHTPFTSGKEPSPDASPPIQDNYSPSVSGKEPLEREGLRSAVAKYLVYAFIAQVCLPFLVMLKWPEQTDNVLKLLTITVSPTVALLGAVMGFYFGSNNSGKN